MTPQEEREALKAMASSPGWAILAAAIQAAEDRIRRDIVESLSPMDIPAARARLAGIALWRDTLAALVKKT